jgi:DNA-binding transcriptional LysR family regulator
VVVREQLLIDCLCVLRDAVCTENPIRSDGIGYRRGMIALLSLVLAVLVSPLRSNLFIYALHPAARYVPVKVRAFIDFLVERFASRSSWA